MLIKKSHIFVYSFLFLISEASAQESKIQSAYAHFGAHGQESLDDPSELTSEDEKKPII